MEAFAEKVAARILARNRAAIEAAAKADNQTSHKGEETAAESKPMKVAHAEGKSRLISRLEAVEAVMATTPIQQVTPNPLVLGMQMPVHMGWMTPYQALMIQQQQASLVGSNSQQKDMLAAMMGLPSVGRSPKRGRPTIVEQNPDNRENHSSFDVLTSGDLKKPGYS